MSGGSRQGDWGDIPDRARQPLGPGAARRRRGYSQQRASAARRGYPQDYSDLATRGGYQQPGARMPGQRPGQPNGGGRSRFVAVVVLVVAAVIVIVGGIAASSGSSGSGSSVSLSLLPFPQNTSTTLGQ
jgi:hypothetical protein